MMINFKAVLLLSIVIGITACEQSDRSKTTDNKKNEPNQAAQSSTKPNTETKKAKVPASPDFSSLPPVVGDHITSLHQSLKKAPDLPERWGVYGDALYANNFTKEAKIAYKNAFDLDSTDPRWMCRLALIHQLTGEHDAALSYIKQARLSKPNDLAILFAEGNIQEELGSYEDALKSYTEAHQIAPRRTETNFALSKVLFNLGRHQESLPHLEKAMIAAPDSSLIRSQLLRLAKVAPLNIKLPEEDKAQNTALISIPPPYFTDIMSQGRMPDNIRFNFLQMLERKDDDSAFYYFDLMATHYPEEAQENEMIDFAHILSSRKNETLSKKVYTKIISINEKSAKAYLGLADMDFRYKNSEEAEKAYLKALDVATAERDKARALQGLSRLTASKGDLSKSLIMMRQALEKWPENKIIHADLVRIHADLKQFDKAVEHMEKAEELGHQFPPKFKRQIYSLAQ